MEAKRRESNPQEVLEVVTRTLEQGDDTEKIVFVANGKEMAMNVSGDARNIADFLVVMLTTNPVLFKAVTDRLAEQMIKELMGLEPRTVPEKCDDPACDGCNPKEDKNPVKQQSDSLN